MKDPFRYWELRRGGVVSNKFKREFQKAVDCIKNGGEVESNSFGITVSKEEKENMK